MPTSKKVATKKKPGVGKYVRSAETRKKLSEAATRQAERARKAKLEAAKASPMQSPVAKRPLGRTAPENKKSLQSTIDEIEQAANTGILNADKAQTTADGARRRSRLAYERADQALDKTKVAHERLDIHLNLWNKLNGRRKWAMLRDVVILIVALVGWAL